MLYIKVNSFSDGGRTLSLSIQKHSTDETFSSVPVLEKVSFNT